MTDPFLTLDDIEVEGKKVLLRVDFNSPYDPGTNEIMDDTRIKAHLETLNRLKDAAVVIMAHQSRPGKGDFTTLRPHARKLRLYMEKEVYYEDSLFTREALNRVEDIAPGKFMLMQNVRFYSEEVKLKGGAEKLSEAFFVRKMAPYFDIFINDAFAAAHRASPSTIGFVPRIPSVAGCLMQKELSVLRQVVNSAERPALAMLGGAKADDSIGIMENMLSKNIVDKVLTTGVVGNMMLMAKGVDLGAPSEGFIKDHVDRWEKVLEKAKVLLKEYPDKIEMPTDVALNIDGARRGLSLDKLPAKNPIHDIGLDTVVHFAREIEEARTVIVNGPAGVFELPEFAFGTEELFRALAHSNAYTVAGGGETSAVLERMGLGDNIDHLSTGGGASITLLGGKHLPVEDALIWAKKHYYSGGYGDRDILKK